MFGGGGGGERSEETQENRATRAPLAWPSCLRHSKNDLQVGFELPCTDVGEAPGIGQCLVSVAILPLSLPFLRRLKALA